MLDYIFFLDLNDTITFKALFEQLVVFFFFYSIINYLFWSAITELLWPTLFFNKRHTSNKHTLRFRTFTEIFLKINLYSNYTYVYNLYLFNKKIFLI